MTIRTPSNLIGDIATQAADNDTGAITAATLRGLLGNIVDTFAARDHVINVTLPPYNCVGNDSTDNSAGLQAAINDRLRRDHGRARRRRPRHLPLIPSRSA